MADVEVNDISDHTVCGDATVLVPNQFRREFGKHRNVKAPVLGLDIEAFKANFRSIKAALPEASWQYAMKANDNPGLLAIMMLEGEGFDCSSLGEIQIVHDVATALGLNVNDVMRRCSYGNPNKFSQDIADAFKMGVYVFSVDDTKEIDKVAANAKGAHVYLRTYVDTTQKTALSVFTNKFGAPSSRIPQLAEYAKNKGLVPYSVGLSVGGGQIDAGAFAIGIDIAAGINAKCQEINVETMDGITFCGGLPAPSAPDAPSFKTIGDSIRAACEMHGMQPKNVTFEPGRSLGTTCGVIEATVVNLKTPLKAGDPWTLVLNIGPFKGLFEMDRTNLTYKMSAYLTHDDEGKDMVRARIADDTCDSKGICFQGKNVMVPKTLVEGSNVYFHNTGSYTTAYVMDRFNRTPALTSFCFPDPLAKVELPDWLKGVDTPGEAAHPKADFPALWRIRQTLTNKGAVEQSIAMTPGSGRLGLPLLPAHRKLELRLLNTQCIASNPNLPGSRLHIGYQQQDLFNTIEEGWIANSSYLSRAKCNEHINIFTINGADAYFCFQDQYRTSVRHCTLMHGTLAVYPKNKTDGPPMFIEVNYDPTKLNGLDTTVVEKTFRNALRNQKSRKPEGDFELLLAGVQLEATLANSDLVWAGELGKRPTLAEYWPEATKKAGGTMRPIDLEGTLHFEWTKEQLSVFLSLYGPVDGSYKAGYAVSNLAHDDRNSCLNTIIRLITTVMMNGRDHHLGDGWSTDRKIHHLAKLAKECRWTNKPGHSIRDIAHFKNASLKVSPEAFMANVQSILCHPTMRQPHGENAYNTIYFPNPTIPHPDYAAQELYRRDAQLAVNLHPHQAAA